MSTWVQSIAQLQEVVEAYSQVDSFVFDVETVGPHRGDPRRNEVAWLSLATYGRADVIPMGHPNGRLKRLEYPILASGKASKDDRKAVRVWTPPPVQLYPGEVFPLLKPLFFGTARKGGQNTKFDICTVTKYLGDIPVGPFDDTMVMSYLLNSSHRPIKGYNKPYSLGAIVKRELDFSYDKSIGSDVRLHGFEEVRKYSYLDAKVTWLAKLKMARRLPKAELQRVYNLEMDVLEVLCSMELEGAPVDEDTLVALDQQLAKEVRDTVGKVYRAAGQAFNLNSPQQKVKVLYGPKSEGGQGLRPRKMTKGGKSGNQQPSTDDEALGAYAGRNAVVDAMLEHAEVSKLHGTYVKAYLHGPVKSGKQLPPFAYRVHPDDPMKRIFADFVQTGAETGRFSCVSGSTLLPTSRGVFRFEEYQPQEGDRVITHRGRSMPVVRKLFKGREQGYRVSFDDGSVIECTAQHRLLTPIGWRYVGDLAVGSEVCGSGGIEACDSGSSVDRESYGGVPGSGQADAGAGGVEAQHELGELPAHRAGEPGPRAAEGRAGAEVLAVEDARREPDAPTEWFPTPRPQGGHPRRPWVSTAQGRAEVRLRASDRDGRGAGHEEAARLGRGSSHRRGQDEQQPGQPSAGDEGGASGLPWPTLRVREVAPLGAMGVWDIEVAGDHSYLSQGLIHHNCREPNLQNIPRPSTEKGRAIRGLFVASPGYVLVVADFAQIEPRVLASLSGDPDLVAAYTVAGRDFYTDIASPFGLDRNAGKKLFLSVAYGIGPDKLAVDTGIPVSKAKAVLDDFDQQFPVAGSFKKQVLAECRRRKPPYVRTLLGRRRFLPEILSSSYGVKMRAERQAFNTIIQGSAADLNKIAMVRLHRALPKDMKLLLTVHDEFVTLVPEDRAEEGAEIVKERMESVGELLRVPTVADVKIVQRWSDAK